MVRRKKRTYKRKSKTSHIRASKEFQDLIREVKARYLLAGKRPPSTNEITKMIKQNINVEDMLKNEFIRF